ncbi:hypothetical protein [Gynuella sp.]|uniref:hypothetical protein n=1 Tax=Gynuella sp. TaxID=2969146 RepID=UPI003D14E435
MLGDYDEAKGRPFCSFIDSSPIRADTDNYKILRRFLIKYGLITRMDSLEEGKVYPVLVTEVASHGISVSYENSDGYMIGFSRSVRLVMFLMLRFCLLQMLGFMLH